MLIVAYCPPIGQLPDWLYNKVMFIAITGRERDLANAELETVFGKITPVNLSVVALEIDQATMAHFEYLGFSKKIAKVSKSSVNKDLLANEIATAIRENSSGSGKLSFGISWHCARGTNKGYYLKLAKNVKKLIQEAGRSARFIQPKDGFELNAAQIHFNKLTDKGCEVILFGSADSPGIAITKWAFNPSAYSHRDYDRPARSAKVGMFPPKLAQVLINLSDSDSSTLICDPFCGSGVVLQEAIYAGHNVVGSDSSEEMIAASQKNLDWFLQVFRLQNTFTLSQNDARNFTPPSQPYAIVTEGYLGPGLSEKPTEALLGPIKSNLEKLYVSFLANVINLANAPKSIVITLPFWQTTTGISYLKVIDQITDLGYTIRQFNSVDSIQLFYRRSQQIVGRQVLVLELKKD